MTNRIEVLLQKHRRLNRLIDTCKFAGRQSEMQQLKRLRLRIKFADLRELLAERDRKAQLALAGAAGKLATVGTANALILDADKTSLMPMAVKSLSMRNWQRASTSFAKVNSTKWMERRR